MAERIGGRSVGAITAACFALAAGVAANAIPEDRALLIYNSRNVDSLAVRNLYIAARPGVLQLDLNDPTLQPGDISRADYLAKVREPVRQFLLGAGPAGAPLNQHVIVLATTRGLPARILGENEFNTGSTWASLESELTLLQQDLESAGSGTLGVKHAGIARNPYAAGTQPITNFSRANITTQRTFTGSGGAWQITGATPGDLYLTARLDAAPTPGVSALVYIGQLIDRSRALRIDPCGAPALLDEWSCTNQLDDDGFGTLFPPNIDDFNRTAAVLNGLGFDTLHDQTFSFVTDGMLPNQSRGLVVLGTYGENHKVNGCGADPAGDGLYISSYRLDPAACFVSYESWNGNSIVTGFPRGDQAQALQFISAGGSFAIPTVAEPFTFSVADLEHLTRNLFQRGWTFAEAAWTAIPGLSWQHTPLGDPLARVARGAGRCDGDCNEDGQVNFLDLNAILADFGQTGACLQGDANRDFRVDFADLNLCLAAIGRAC